MACSSREGISPCLEVSRCNAARIVRIGAKLEWQTRCFGPTAEFNRLLRRLRQSANLAKRCKSWITTKQSYFRIRE